MYTERGRWGGRLTSRPLPEADGEIDALSDEQRGQVVAVWLGRAASERRVADAFAVIERALRDLDSDEDLITLAARGVDDEHRHAEIARRVATRFAGRDLDAPARLALVVPEHPGAEPGLLATLHVLGHCAMNETLASAFLEASLHMARGELARAAVRELLADEIDHARIGWAHLATLSDVARAQVAPWLPAMMRANLRMWREAPRAYPTDAALHRHGAPPADVVEEALLGAIRELIVPGFERFGLPTGELRAWLGQGAPTG